MPRYFFGAGKSSAACIILSNIAEWAGARFGTVSVVGDPKDAPARCRACIMSGDIVAEVRAGSADTGEAALPNWPFEHIGLSHI